MKSNINKIRKIIVGMILILLISSFVVSGQKPAYVDNKFINEKSRLNNSVSDENSFDFQKLNMNYTNRYAVLAVGNYYHSQDSYTWFLRDVQRLYWTLAIKHGFDEEDIYVLITLEDGLEAPEIFNSGIIDYTSTEYNLQLVLNNLKNVMNEDDLFFFCIIDHGNSEGFELYSDWVSAVEFASYVDGIFGELVFILQPCGSGGLIDELSKENRIIGTSVSADEGDGSWMGKFTMGLIFYGDIDEEIGNQDGNVSIEEAHHYAARHVYETYGLHSLIDDNADKVGHHYTSSEYDIDEPTKDAYIAARTFLGGETFSNPPNKPETPTGPTNGTTGVIYSYSTNVTDPENDPVIYGWDWDGDLIINNWKRPINSGTEEISTHKWDEVGVYEVRVRAMDIHGEISNWSDPLIVTIEENEKPNAPDIDGPTSCKVGIAYKYNISSTDPNGDDILKYIIDWGDGNEVIHNGPFPSGKEVIVSHVWDEKGVYLIRVKAMDICGAESDWGELEVNIPRTRLVSNLWYQWILYRFPLLERLISLLL